MTWQKNARAETLASRKPGAPGANRTRDPRFRKPTREQSKPRAAKRFPALAEAVGSLRSAQLRTRAGKRQGAIAVALALMLGGCVEVDPKSCAPVACGPCISLAWSITACAPEPMEGEGE
jgi:hypothetical protein